MDNDTKKTEEWDPLVNAIYRGDVSTVQTLLTRYPDLIRYRGKDVSPPYPTHNRIYHNARQIFYNVHDPRSSTMLLVLLQCMSVLTMLIYWLCCIVSSSSCCVTKLCLLVCCVAGLDSATTGRQI
jgi:hypothetical protein